MELFKHFSNAFSVAGKKARQAYDHTKLELRIKSYEKELREAYAEIGRLTYQTHKSDAVPNREKLDGLFGSIDNITFRIQRLNKTIQEIKKQNEVIKTSKPDAQANDASELSAFAKLARKEGDLKIRRTEGGIQVLRFCTACGFGNEPTEAVCASCGYAFKTVVNESEKV